MGDLTNTASMRAWLRANQGVRLHGYVDTGTMPPGEQSTQSVSKKELEPAVRKAGAHLTTLQPEQLSQRP